MHAASAGVATFTWGRQGLADAVSSPSSATELAAGHVPLAPQPYSFLPVGSIKPRGWLRTQLEIQASGLSGHLGEIWPDVGPESGWLGGTGEAWERGPYYLDGLVPLAWLLDSQTLKDKALQFINWTLNSQGPDGMFGPKGNDPATLADPWWPRMVMMKALTQYQELTSDNRVIPFMTRYFQYQLSELSKKPLVAVGKARWQDGVVSLVWLYARTGNPHLIELARLLRAQGTDWQSAFENFQYKERVTPRDHYVQAEDQQVLCHGVNNAMALKASAVWSLISSSESDRTAVRRQLSTLDRYQGLPTGMFAADEFFAGRNPSQGTELCAVVEALYSLEQALAITGDTRLADRIERIAYNALPGAFTDDMWAHQYDQQCNQIQCSLAHGPWATNGNTANLFGLEPQFGCCTANFHQGWPKFATSLWMRAAEQGLAAMMYAPCEVSTLVRDVPVRLIEETDYPFRDRVAVMVEPDRPIAFPLKFRIPGWSQDLHVLVNGRPSAGHRSEGLFIIERTWRKGDRIELTFGFTPQMVRGFNQSVSVEDGPLLFVFPIETRWEKLVDNGLSSADWEVYSAGPWNYGIAEGSVFNRSERTVSPVPFSVRSPAATLQVEAQMVPQWKVGEGCASFAPPPPESPVQGSGVIEKLTLVPYGSAKLRITSFPTVNRS
jgi:uncharacterized protein